MSRARFAERHPTSFSISLLLLMFLAGAVSVLISQASGRPLADTAIFGQLFQAVALVILISAIRWWLGIGYRAAGSARQMMLYAPALVLVIGNLIANLWLGVAVNGWAALLTIVAVGLLSGFAEESIFRGLMLRAFLPRGVWRAVLASTAFFGLAHTLNLLGGISSPLYVLVQIGYALAIGFCFAAMAVKGG